MNSEIKFSSAKIMQDGENWLCLKVDDIKQARRFIDNKNKDKPYIAIVKVYRQKRSLDANAYAWVLIGKLAEILDITDLEIYREYILKAGVYRQLEISEKAYETFKTAWGMHGKGWICEKLDYVNHQDFALVNAYYGSSTYDTKQMYRLIKMIVDDCIIQGIETKTPDEIARLISLWKN